MPWVVLSQSHAMTWPPLYGNGVYNVTSGLVPPISQESRALRGSTEWSLSQEVFNAIQERWGPFDVDLFASTRFFIHNSGTRMARM